MDEIYSIDYVLEPGRSEWMTIGQGIGAYNAQQAGDDSSTPLCFVLRDAEGTIVGGVLGETHYDWLYVNLMWIRADLRDRGFGAQLLTMAEDEARKRGATHAYLDTFSFQAPGFYKKQGYREFGKLEHFPGKHTRYFLCKDL